MKSNFTLLTLFLVASTMMFAQKKTAKTTSAKSTTAATGIASYLGKDIDNTMLSLNDFLIAKKLNVTKLDEGFTNVLDENYIPTKEIETYSKTLYIGDEIYIELISNADKKIKTINISFVGKKEAQNKFSTDIGTQAWETILTQSDIIIKKKANTRALFFRSEGYMFITVEDSFSTKEYTAAQVPFDSLNVNHSWNQYVGTLLQKTVQGTTKLLHATDKKINLEDNQSFQNMYQEFYFTNGVKMSVYQEKNKHIVAYINVQNPVVYGTFKRNFIKKELKPRYKFGEGTMYRTQNVMMLDNTPQNYLKVYSLPAVDDIVAKSKLNSEIPSLHVLDHYYNSFENNPSELPLFLNDHFVSIENSNRIIFSNPEGDTTIGFYYNTKNSDYWGLKLVIDYFDENYISKMKEEAEDNDLVYSDFTVNGAKFQRTQFYDKTTYTAYKTGNDIKQQADKIAQQKREAEELKQQIEDDKRKAQRNAEWQGVINQATSDLIKIFGK